MKRDNPVSLCLNCSQSIVNGVASIPYNLLLFLTLMLLFDDFTVKKGP